jgi:hypothetical protein
VKSELAKLEPTLTPEQRQTLASFLGWYQDDCIARLDPETRETLVKFIAMAKERLRLP